MQSVKTHWQVRCSVIASIILFLGYLDTGGLYHADNTEDENSDYCLDLIYKGDIDAIIMVVPLFGDSNFHDP